MGAEPEPLGGPQGPSERRISSDDRRLSEVVPSAPSRDRGEIQVEEGALVVTFHLPEIEPAELGYHLGPRTLSLWSRRTGVDFRTIMVLPLWVKPERFVLSHKNGVYEFLLEQNLPPSGLPA